MAKMCAGPLRSYQPPASVQKSCGFLFLKENKKGQDLRPPQGLSLSPFIINRDKGVSQQAAFDVAQNIIQATPTLTQLSGDVTIGSFCPKGFVGIGLSIGTDAFIRNLVVGEGVIEGLRRPDFFPYSSSLSAFLTPNPMSHDRSYWSKSSDLISQ